MTLRWTLRNQNPPDVWVYREQDPFGRMVLPADEPRVAYAEIDGLGLRIAWTDQSFFRVAEAASGKFVGEARFLPWKPGTFRALVEGLRSYRWDFERSAWLRDERSVVVFEGDRIYAPDDYADATQLIALGLLVLVTHTAKP